MRELKSCGVLIHRPGPPRALLLMEHSDRLDLPKGHVEPGETEVACALRELEEETGLRPADVSLDHAFRWETTYQCSYRKYPGETIRKTLVIFLGELRGAAQPQCSDEHCGLRWLTWAPPHRVQTNTIDPLLAALAEHWSRQASRTMGT